MKTPNLGVFILHMVNFYYCVINFFYYMANIFII